MKSIFSFIAVFVFTTTVFAASPDSSLYETGRRYMLGGDMENAVMVLKRALQQDPGNVDIQKDLEYSFFLKRDYTNAIELGKKTITSPGADDMCYQMLGMSYKAIAEYKECEKLYKQGLKAFPNSGVLYNEFGDLYAMQTKLEVAIKYWELGIEKDPNYSSNYYNAANYYDRIRNYIWAVVYGEIFVNMESVTPRSNTIKKILLDDYKILLSSPDQLLEARIKGNKFTKAFASILLDHINKVSTGITVESLTAIRSEFVRDWFAQGAIMPFRLFDQHRQLYEAGIFNAYNQWLFVSSDNTAAYQTWVKNNAKENDQFFELQRNRVFKIPQGQYYRK